MFFLQKSITDCEFLNNSELIITVTERGTQKFKIITLFFFFLHILIEKPEMVLERLTRDMNYRCKALLEKTNAREKELLRTLHNSKS